MKLSLNNIMKKLSQNTPSPVLVVGDIILDRYQHGEVERISPEAPVPVVRVIKEEFRLGGAANVANNIKALGGRVEIIGAVGKDYGGDVVKGLLRSLKIEASLVELEEYPTIEKTRIIARRQQVVRVDKEQASIEDLLYLRARGLLEKIKNWNGVIVISDYGKGFLGRKSLSEIFGSGRCTIVDPKQRNFSNYYAPYLITPNKKEGEELSGMSMGSKEEILGAGRNIIKRMRCKNLLITLGPKGMVLFEGKEIYHLPSYAREVFDVTGAGDTVVGVVALGLAAGLSLLESCIFANFCAGKVVGKVGTATVGWKEIEEDATKWKGYLKVKRWE